MLEIVIIIYIILEETYILITLKTNHLGETSLNSSFISDKSTKIFFDMPEDYGQEYDSAFYFSIDQFQIDSLDKSSLPKFEFPGTFIQTTL